MNNLIYEAETDDYILKLYDLSDLNNLLINLDDFTDFIPGDLNRLLKTKSRLFFKQRKILLEVLSDFMICESEDILADISKRGKPFITNPRKTNFNISHSGNLYSIVISKNEKEIGVDIERLEKIRNINTFNQVILTKYSKDLIKKYSIEEKNTKLLELWCSIEAYSKCNDSSLFSCFKSSIIDCYFKTEHNNAFLYNSTLVKKVINNDDFCVCIAIKS